MEEPQSPSKLSLDKSQSLKEEEESLEDIPELEYQEMVKEMETKKEHDQINQVEGREQFDYSVARKRKKTKKEENHIEQSPPKLVKKDTIDPDLIEWIKERVESSINMFDAMKHWTPSLEDEVKRLCLLEQIGLKLFIWIEQDKAHFTTDVPKEITFDTAIVFKLTKDPVSELQIQSKILVRKVEKNHLKSLIAFMNNLFIPTIMAERSWPDNVKKEFLAQLHKFMTSITEACFQLEGYTELYIPKEDLSNSDGQDKDLIQRLETTIIQWNRQIKEIVSNPDSHQENENSGPLNEIEYWRNRRENLKHIDEQLENVELKAIVRFLQKMDSNDARGFGELAENIKTKSEEAQNNLMFLESLYEPCTTLEKAEPKEIPDMLPQLLKRVRMIWHHSKFYNSNDRITNLLNKISNQIIQRCKAKINVDDMLDGDVEKCIEDLNDAIQCGKRWREIYDRFADVINTTEQRKWSFVTNSIFASVEAFVQRCSELIEICQGQLQFALKGRDNQLPRFGGARASEIVGILLQIKGAFVKLIDKFKGNKKDKILDVKASNWHQQYNAFKSGVKQLDVMYQNVIDFAFKQVTTVQQGVNMLEAFDYLSKRDSIKTCVKKKAIEVMNLFIAEIESAKQEIENKKDPNIPLHHGKYSGGAILIRSVIFRLEKFKDKIDKLYFIDDGIKAAASEKYTVTVKQLESLIKDQKLAVWKDENKGFEEPGNLNKSIESVTILCRPDENHQDYKLPLEILKPKPHHIQCNFDRKLLKLINQVSTWKILIPFNIRIPNEPDEFVMSNRQNLRVLRELSMVVVRQYNQIIDFMDDNERNLFAQHLQATNKIIQPGITRFKWSSKANVDSFLGRTCRGVCSDLYHKLKEFKANTEKIQQKCQQISSKLFLKINKKHSYQIEQFYDQQKDHRHDIKDKLQKILKEITDILGHSYELFATGRKDTQLFWFNYVKDIDRKIEDALKKGIKNSLVEFYLVIGDQEKNIQPTPIFIISAILERDDPPKLAYKPTTSSLLETITEIISSINDVVSGFPKVQNKMYEVYKKRREEVLARMEKQKNPNRKTVQEEEVKPLEGYLYYKISDDTDIQKYSSKIINNLNKVCNEVTKDSTKDKWTNSPLFWQNKRKQKFIKNVVDYNWMDISQLKEQIQNSNAQSEQIQEIKSSHPIGCINLDDSRFKTTLSEIVILWQNMFMNYLQERCIDELKSLHELFKTSEANLTPEPQNLQELKKNTDLWQELMNNREEFEKKLDPLKDKFAELDMHSIQLKEEENRLRATLVDAWLHYNNMLLEIQKRNERVRGVFEYQAKKNKDDFLKEAFDLKVNFEQNAPFQSTYSNENAFNNLNEYNDIVKGLRTRWNDMIFGFELFQISYTSPADLDHVDKQIKHLTDIWTLKEDWDQNYKTKVKDIKFKQINCQNLEEYADDYIYKLNGLSKEAHIRRWGITTSLKQSIENFKTVLPLIDFLRKPFMRPRHWIELRNHIDFDPESQLFTFDEIFVQKNFTGHSETINTTCEVAREEYKIESALEKIKKQWENLEIATETHKKTWKVKGTDAIFATLEDNMGVLSTQKTGLFYDNFKDQIEDWQNKLQRISETLEMLVQVQRQWIYLQAIFASQQDQDRQLIGDINKFQNLNIRIGVHMDRIHNKPNILAALLVENFYQDLDDISKRLDESQKVLNSLLETKRGAFPRFYFLANDDLFELLGNSRDPAKVNKHIKKCFEGIKKLAIASTPIPGKKNDNFTFDVTDLISPEEQIVKLVNKVPVENGVENWLKQTEKQMRETLKKYLFSTFSSYSKKKDPKAIADWVEHHYGQLLITTSQIHWSMDCENILKAVMNSEKPDKGKAWKGLKEEKAFFLSQLTKQVRKTTKTVARLKLIALITIEVHARDITDILSKTCFSVNSFEWKKQLRFKVELQGQSANCTVEQTNTSFPYGYEYQGNNGRLVVTSLTDRCYMTLTTAMHLKKGGAPQGPAGTGKTQTVKDLGKGLAKFVVVFNCSEGLDYKSLGRMFSGLMQTGGWGCFDQFNRIQLEVLSVVAQQMLSILNALKESKKGGFNNQNPFTFNFDGSTIPLNDQCAIFITMNPGYAGRSELPDNLKSLFRPISMMVPESTMICEIMLSSEGFKYGKPISNKIVVLYQMMSQQLSKQDHYDFGLRAIKSVLTCAGAIRRDANIESPLDKVDKKDKELIKELEEQQLNQEILILMKAIMDMNIPKFVGEDQPLFQSLFNDLFPNMEMQEMNNELFLTTVEAQMKKAGLIPKPELVKKVVQLYDSKNTRHGNMLVGTSMSGKSTCWKMLRNTLNALSKENPKKYPQVKYEVLNPKAVDLKQLFGFLDLNGEWHEGVLSSMMSRLCKEESQAQRWMILDGPVDTLWIESMNTVLDDNKVLTLLNGDRINLPPQVGLVFQVQDLAVASPATVSRAGMIYVNLNELGWRPYFQSWLSAKVKEEIVADAIKELVEKWFAKLFDKKKHMKDEFRQYVPSLEISVIIAFTKLIDAFLAGEGKGADFNMPNKPDNYFSLLEKWFIFCMVWSFGGTLDEIGRKTFDLVVRDIESFFPGNFTVFDYYINPDKGEWHSWQEKVNNMVWKPSPSATYHSLLVPTVDSARTKYVLQTCVLHKIHTLSVGTTGTGKTVLINQILSELDEGSWKINNIIYSSQTSSQKTQDMIEGKMVRRTKSKMVPDGKKMVIYVDDLNMPKKDTYFSQPPLQLLRQWMDYGGWFDRTQNEIFKKIEDIQFISSMGPPGGGRNQISRRIQTKFTMINFMFPSETQVRRVFHNILSHKFMTQDFDDQIKQISETLAYATINLYNAIAENFLPTPAKSHYMFNMRDISKVIQGVYIFDKFYCDSKLTIYRLWVHESLRVFHDRLVNDKDREKLKKLISDQLEQTLQSNMKQCTDNDERETIFVDFFDESQNRQIYIQVVQKQREELKKIIEEKLVQFNQKFKSAAMNITLFEVAISYVCRINRIIKFQRGHGMLVGEGGAGRHSLTKLATFIAKYNLCQVTISKGFKLKEFREKIKQWSQQCAFKENGAAVFMFSDNQITEESFVEDINTILTIGEIPNLYGKEDLPTIKEKMKKVVSRMLKEQGKEGKDKDIKDELLLSEFYSRIQNNFHIVFLMSKTGDNLRNYGRMYPGLINNTTIIYFMPWPTEALYEVANNSLKQFDFEQNLRNSISEFFSNAHTKVMSLADKMWKDLKRIYYVTPTNYIELVKGYSELLNFKREEIGSQIQKLAGGLGKLDEAQANSNELQKNLAIFNNELGKKSKDCEQLMIKIDKETRESKDKKNELAERETQVNKEKNQIEHLKADAEADLKKAEPALLAAELGLANLTKDKLSVVKSYSTPPGGVDVVLNAVMILLNKEPSWAIAKKQLADTSFLQRLQTIDKGRVPINTLKRIEKLTQDPKMQISRIDTISEAAGGLWRWVLAVEGYAKAFKDIEPKKNKVNNLMQKLKKSEDQLQQLRDNFSKVQQVINGLNIQLQKAKSDMESYKVQTEQLQIKLERAEKLITGLASTKEGWKERKQKLQEKYSYIIGDSLMTAAFLSYAGPFPSEYRNTFLNEQLLGKVKHFKISHSKDYNFPEFLVKPVDFIKWGLKGLPDDQFSKENGVLVRKGRMFPLMIDPQLQGNRWIREMQKQNKEKFVILDPQTQNFMKTIELSVANGNVVLLQNLEEEIDSSLQPLLNKTIKKVADRYLIYLGDKDIRYNQNFKLFMTTKLPNPKYKPEVTTKVILVNFTVKEKGLEQQLTSVVIQRMEMQLENSKNELIKNKSDNQQKMKKIDDGILKSLSSAKTNLIDDQNIIVYLQQSKETEEKVRHQIQSSIAQMKKINLARQNYKKLAKVASKLFFIINDFALIDSMYQFSLDAYIGLFQKTIKEYIEKPGLNDSLNEKLDAIADKLKTGIYRYACRGLFEKDKLLLGFMMTVRLKEVDQEEYNFFLKGGKDLTIDRKNQPLNPNEWIEPSNWNTICDLQKLPNFPNIIGAFIHNAKEWKKWYMSANPEKEPLPGQWNEKCDSLRKLIVTKIIRRDRVIPALINFIVDKNGNETFVHPPNPSLQNVYADSTKNTPIVFVLSPGVDPYNQLAAFAKTKDVLLVDVSLGQGQAKIAKEKVNQGAKNGSWLYLANCHLSLSFLKDLEKLLEAFEMNKNDVNDKFRLWLSTNPHPKFPISILQRCVKITTEPPKGMKANMLRLYQNMPKQLHQTSPANRVAYRRVLYSLCWYHSLIIERKRFKTLGWNIIYDFNDSDWDTADKILQIYIQHAEEVKHIQSSVTGEQPVIQRTPPWDAIRYLISDVTYGGRVTDDWDRRLLNVYATQYFNQAVISEDKHRLGSPNLAQYTIPEEQPQKERAHEPQPRYYSRKIQEFPPTEKPEVFGQHINAEISSQIADTNILLESLQALEAFSSMTGDSSAEQKVKQIIAELLLQLDEPLNEEQVYDKVKPQDQNPLKIVLIQEISRYNKLLKLVRKNLQDLQKGINGLVLISEELERVMFSLFENKVPEKWKFAYYSLKPLLLWMTDLNKRVEQLRSWVNKGQPNVFWISGFSFPTGFTTALQQQASRKSNVPIDQFIWEFSFEKMDTTVLAPAKEGAYISGLFLEGAKWDGDKNCITEPEPMKLFYRMPIIQFKPIFVEGKQKAKKGQNLYACPTYMYPIRTGVVERKSYMFTVMLPIKPGVNNTSSSDQDFWTKRGAALLMSLANQEL